MRKQYHFQKGRRKWDAWDVDLLIEKSRDLPMMDVPLSEIKELDQDYWYREDPAIPTCRSLVEHMRLVMECDGRYPIILAADGRLMDGMHRVCKALLESKGTLKAVRFEVTPAPDFREVMPADLPY